MRSLERTEEMGDIDGATEKAGKRQLVMLGKRRVFKKKVHGTLVGSAVYDIYMVIA